MRTINHFIGGRSVTGGDRMAPVYNPSIGKVQAEVTLGDADLLAQAVEDARAAQPAWAALNPQRRARVMFRLKELIERDMDELAHLLSTEHGKVSADSRGDIQRGLDVVEFACGIPHLLKGEYSEGAGPGIE